MTDIDIAHPIDRADVDSWEKKGSSVFADKRKAFIKLNAVSVALNFIQGLVNLGLCALVFYFAVHYKIIPLFIAFNGEVVQTLQDASELPTDKLDDAVKSVLWTLVDNWQTYTFTHAKRRYDTVSALTTGTAQQKYQHWFTQEPRSPQKRINTNGWIEVHEQPNTAQLLDKIASCKNADWCEASLSFYRKEQMFGQMPGKETLCTAQISYIFVDGVPAQERGTINPATIKATSVQFDGEGCGE